MKAARNRNGKVAQQQASFALKPIAYGVMLACCGAAWGNPTGPQVMHGAAQIQGLGSNHLKVTNTPGSIIHWQGFSIGAGQVTQFVQQSASSSVLNRVVGADISQIHGQLLSNGRVFLINPAGILIGAGAVIDTAGFVGSTLNMLDGDFLAGKLKFQGGEGAGSIVNQGWIKAGQGGNIVLVAPNIENSGIIQTEGGQIVLAAGRKMTIGSMELEGVQFEIQAPSDSVLNVGKLLADGGAVGVFAGTLKHSGDIRANALTRDAAGRIVLQGKEDVTLTAGSTVKADGKAGGAVTVQSTSGTTIVSGDISAKGSEGKGGDVRVLGNQVGLLDSGTVDASGTTGGGQVLIGGDFQGKNADVQNAQQTHLSSDSTVRADGLGTGDGGRIIVWSDGTTRAYGDISARGGALSGRGGFIETSGHFLDFGKTPDAGAGGTWLIDPLDITISNGLGNANMTGASPFQPQANNTTPTRLSVATLQGAMNGASNIIVQTGGATGAEDGDIIFDASPASGGAITLTRNPITSNGTLTLNAQGDIRFTGGLTTFAVNGGQALTVVLNANTGGIVTTNTGGVTLTTNNAPVTMQVPAGKTWENSGTITVNAGNVIELLTGGGLFGRLQNNVGGVLTFASGAGTTPLTSAANAGIVTNAGTLSANGGTGGMTLAADFNSTGTFQVAGGTVILPNASTISGALSIVPTGTLAVRGNSNAILSDLTITNTGALTISGVNGLEQPQATFRNVSAGSTTLTVGQNSTVAFDTAASTFNNVTLPFVGSTAGPISAGNLTVNTDLSILNNLTIGGGAVAGVNDVSADFNNGTTTVGNIVTFNVGTFGGSGTFTAATLDWNGGTISGNGPKTFNNITSDNTSGATALNGRLGVNGGTWANNGTLTQDQAGRVTLSNNAVINNTAGNNWTLAATAADATPITGVGTFNNPGTFTSNSANIQSITGINFANTGLMNVNAGTLTLPAAAVADTGDYAVGAAGILAFGGARTLAVGADVTGTGTARFSAGEVIVNSPFGISGTGLVVIDGGTATFNTTPGPVVFTNTLTQSAGVLQGSAGITTNGIFNWSGGTVTGTGAFTTGAPGTVNITNAVTLNARTWTNNGTVNQTADGKLTLASNATVNNNNIWNLRTNELNPITGAGTFSNDGTLLNDLPNPPVTHTISPTIFNNTNLVNVTEGTLIINAGGIHAGNFDVAAGKVIEFGAGTHTFNNGTVLQGDGTIRFTGTSAGTIPLAAGGNFDDLVNLVIAGGSLTVNNTGFNNITNTTVSSGTLTLAGAGDTDTLTVSGTGQVNVNAALTMGAGPLTVSGGTLTVNADSTSAGLLNLSGGTITGTALLTINGTGSQWTGGTMSGAGSTIFSGANTLDITGAADKFLNQRSLTTSTGTTTWTGGTIGAGNGGTFTVNGIFDIGGATNKTWSSAFGGAPTTITIAPTGTLRHSGAATDSLSMAIVDGAGAIDVQAGVLRLSPGLAGSTGTLTGAITIGAGTLDFAGGTYNVNDPGSIAGAGNLTISGGVFTTNAPVTTTGALTISSGAATFNPTTPGAVDLTPSSVTISAGTAEFNRIITDGGAFTLSGGTARLNSDSTIAGAFNFSSGTLTGAGQVHANGGGAWTGGTLNGTGNGQLNVPAGQTLTLSGAGAKVMTSNAFLASDGTINWSGGAIDVTNGSQIFNGTTGVFAATGNTTMQVSGGAGTFTNNNIFRRAGAGSTTVNGALTFINNATVDTPAGTLTFDTANASFANGSSFTGAGTTRLTAGGAFAGAVASTNLELAGGPFTGTWNIPAGSTVNWTGGSLNGAGTTTVSAGTPGGTLNISGNALKTVDNGHVLSIGGLANWTGSGDINIANGSQINTTATGTFDAQVARAIRMNTGTGTFNNAGLFQKTLDAGTTTVLADFNNSGAVNVDAGLLDLRGGTDTGDYGIAAGSTLQFRLGARALNAGVDISGPGTATVDFAGGTVTLGAAFNQPVGTPKWLVSGATVNNTAGLTLNGAFDWTAGTITGAGTLTTSGTATTTIGGMAILDGTTWTNAGAVNLTAVQLVLGGAAATFTNNGIFTDTGGHAAPITFTGGVANKSFVNAGTFNKNANTAQTISVAFSNTGAGTLNVNGGTLQLNAFPTNAGTINLANNATLSTNGNDLASSGTIGGIGTVDLAGGLLTSSGTLRPGASPGTLNITGDLMMTGASVTDIEIQAPGTTPGTDFDVINVTGQADLAGTLNVLHLGGFTPPAGASFTIINYAAHTGDFTTKNFPFGYTYTTAINPTSYVLDVLSFQNIWTFAGSGQWDQAGNWSLGRIPIATDDTVIPDRAGFVDTITVAAGTQSAAKLTASENLAITGGQLTLGAGPSVSNANLDVSGGILIVNGPLTANNLGISGGSLQGTGAVNVGGDLFFSGGILANTAGVTVAGNTIVNAGAPQLNGSLSTAVLDMNGSTLGIGTGGILIISGPGTSQIANSTLNNAGVVRINTPGNDVLIGNASVVNNDATGVIEIQNDVFLRGAGGGVVNNAGSFRKTGGTGDGGADATLPFNNIGGLIDAQMGAIRLSGGGTHTGQFRTGGNGVNLDGGTHVFAAGSSIEGPSFVFLNGGATLDATGNPIVNSSLTWNGPGTITGGTLTIAPGATFAITGLGTHAVDGVTLINQGVTTHEAADLRINSGAEFNNAASGVFDFRDDVFVRTTAGAGTFKNSGSLLKSVGTGSGGFSGAGFTLVNNGGIHVQSGTLEASGFPTNAGNLTIDAGAVFSTNGNPLLNQGAVRGKGVLQLAGAALTNASLVAPGASPGTLVIDGDYVQTPAGALAIELGGLSQGTTYDLLQITGNAVLDGILSVTNVGGFVPAAGNNFEFMTYNSHTGNFAAIHPPVGTQLQASPGAMAYSVISPSGFNSAGVASEPTSETRRLYDDFLEIIPAAEDAVEKPPRAALVCD